MRRKGDFEPSFHSAPLSFSHFSTSPPLPQPSPHCAFLYTLCILFVYISYTFCIPFVYSLLTGIFHPPDYPPLHYFPIFPTEPCPKPSSTSGSTEVCSSAQSAWQRGMDSPSPISFASFCTRTCATPVSALEHSRTCVSRRRKEDSKGAPRRKAKGYHQ